MNSSHAGCLFSVHRSVGLDHRSTVDHVHAHVRRNTYRRTDRHIYHHTYYLGHHVSVNAPYQDRNPKEAEEEVDISSAPPRANSLPRALHRKALLDSQDARAARMEHMVVLNRSCCAAGHSRSVGRARIRSHSRTAAAVGYNHCLFAPPLEAVESYWDRKSSAAVYAAARSLVGWDVRYADRKNDVVEAAESYSLDIANRRTGRRAEAVRRMGCIVALAVADGARSGRKDLHSTCSFRFLDSTRTYASDIATEMYLEKTQWLRSDLRLASDVDAHCGATRHEPECHWAAMSGQ